MWRAVDLVDDHPSDAPSPYVSTINFAFEKGTEAEREKAFAEGVAFLKSSQHWCCQHSRRFISVLSHLVLSPDAVTESMWHILTRQLLSCSDWYVCCPETRDSKCL